MKKDIITAKDAKILDDMGEILKQLRDMAAKLSDHVPGHAIEAIVVKAGMADVGRTLFNHIDGWEERDDLSELYDLYCQWCKNSVSKGTSPIQLYDDGAGSIQKTYTTLGWSDTITIVEWDSFPQGVKVLRELLEGANGGKDSSPTTGE